MSNEYTPDVERTAMIWKKHQRCQERLPDGTPTREPRVLVAAPQGAALQGAALQGAAPQGAAPQGPAPQVRKRRAPPPAATLCARGPGQYRKLGIGVS